MEQNTEELYINMQIFCKANHYCNYVCIQHHCVEQQMFICQQPTCGASLKHKKCQKCQIKPTLAKIQQKHALQYQKYQSSLKAIEDIYDSIIWELSVCREQFKQYVSTFGINQKTVQLIKYLNQASFDQSSRQMWFKTNKQVQKNQQNNIYSGLDSIKLLKQSILCKINSIKTQLKGFEYKPEEKRLTAKSLEQCFQFTQIEAQIRIRKFFTKPIDEFTLIYRASDHDFSAQIFHQKCDWIEDTILLVKNQQGKVFGGYTPLEWSQISNSKFKHDNNGQSFLFSVNLNQKFSLVQKQKALYCNSHYGPTFGSGFDLFISNHCNKNSNSFANFTNSYKNPKFLQNQQSLKAITGKTKSNQFRVIEYQIFKITWK